MERYMLYYLAAINLAAFFLMWLDKRRARRDGRRIPERRLFAVALLGGTPGAILGMYRFFFELFF